MLSQEKVDFKEQICDPVYDFEVCVLYMVTMVHSSQ